MSKKVGVLGACLSLSVAASLTGNLFLIKEMNNSNNVVEKKVQTINADLDELSKQIDKVRKEDSSLVGSDLEKLASKVVEIETKLGGLQTKVDEIPDIVQVGEDGNVVTDKPTGEPTKPDDTNKKEPVKPDDTEKKEPVKPDNIPTAPTVENPTFKTTSRLNFRNNPSTTAPIQTTFAKGEVLTWVDNLSKESDGYTWIKVKDSKGKTGWVAQKYITKQ